MPDELSDSDACQLITNPLTEALRAEMSHPVPTAVLAYDGAWQRVERAEQVQSSFA